MSYVTTWVETLRRMKDELPALAGGDWPELEKKLDLLFEEYERPGADQEEVGGRIIELVRKYPKVYEAIGSRVPRPKMAVAKRPEPEAQPGGGPRAGRPKRVEAEAAEPGMEEKGPEPTKVRVFYGTDRMLKKDEKDPARMYKARRNRDGLTLGTAVVNIPPGHEKGKLEQPQWYKGEFKEDDLKHVILDSATPLDRGEFIKQVKGQFGADTKDEALVFLHGFNENFKNVARRTAQLKFDLGFEGPALFYSWPSYGGFMGFLLYPVECFTIQKSVGTFGEFLRIVLKDLGIRKVHVIAHSMGNRALVKVLEGLQTGSAGDEARLGQVVFAAPDVDGEKFREAVKEFKDKAERFTLYASSEDLALKASEMLHLFRPRAGDTDDGSIDIGNVMDKIDATRVDTTLMEHGYFSDNKTVINDIGVLLEEGLPPDRRKNLRRMTQEEEVYWQFTVAERMPKRFRG